MKYARGSCESGLGNDVVVAFIFFCRIRIVFALRNKIGRILQTDSTFLGLIDPVEAISHDDFGLSHAKQI